jgi:hypothetical protein
MFRTSARVWIPIGAGSVPGVCVADPILDSYTNRRGASVRTERVPVISMRTLPDRPSWHQLSYESTTLLSARETVEAGLDVDDAGNPVPLSALWVRQRESLQAYLASRQQPQPAAKAKR